MVASYTFDAPHRGLGIRVYNAMGRTLRRLGLTLGDLSEESLMRRAQRRTGLSDFGDENFRAPLRVLLKAYEEESDLHPAGRLMARINILVLLCNRLRVQDLLNRHPEILQRPIDRPMFVVALPRTGTTLLYNLLALDPQKRPLMMWEAITPVPRKSDWGKQPDPRIRRVLRVERAIQRLAPNLATVHPIRFDGPEECSRLLLNTFVTAYAVMENHVPSYRDWFLNAPPEVLESAYRDYYRQLQVVQWVRPVPGRWVLKSPAHVFGMRPLMQVFPDARIVQLHRDPQKVIPSLCSLFAVYQGMASDHVRARQLGPEMAGLCAEGLQRSYEARQASEPGRVFDLRYQDLVADAIGAVRRIYDHFGESLSEEYEQRMRTWLAENPRDKHGKHRYDLQQFGLSRELIDRLYQSYCRQYDIEPEGRPATAITT